MAAADQAIAADPTQPVAYYLKGQALISKAAVDPKTNRIVAPQEAVVAYEKYLELAPNAPQANEVRQLLAEAGVKAPRKPRPQPPPPRPAKVGERFISIQWRAAGRARRQPIV